MASEATGAGRDNEIETNSARRQTDCESAGKQVMPMNLAGRRLERKERVSLGFELEGRRLDFFQAAPSTATD